MTVLAPHSEPLTLSRRVSVSPDRAIVVQATAEPFLGRVFPRAAEDPGTADAAPRDRLAHHTVWYPPGQPVELNPGDRLLDDTTEFEVVRGTRGKRAGTEILVLECHALPVAELYPVSAQVTGQGGAGPSETVDVALWAPSESHSATGDYEDYAGEAPAEHAAVLGRNVQLRVGVTLFRVTTASTDLITARVTFRARRTERG